MRKFDGGATRDASDGKLDYEGFYSPLAMERYAQYMDSHRKQADGKMRDSDNWQAGMPRNVYMKSLFRHLFTVWKVHRGIVCRDERDNHVITLAEALCAMLFNGWGYLHEVVLGRDIAEESE